MKSIKSKIMRRVYYSYGVSMVSHNMFWQGMVLGACVALFGRLTHVASIFHNFMAVPLQNTPQFITNSFVHAFTQGEVLTGLVVLFMIGLSISFIYRAVGILSNNFVLLRT